MSGTDENSLNPYEDELVEVIDLDGTALSPADLAAELEDVDIEEADGGDDNGWQTEDEEMEAKQDDSNLTFSKHQGSVFCVHLDPATNTLAVTGGEDDKAFVWRVSDGQVLFECTGHKDSVTCAGFSHDSKLVATGDMSGLIKVWKIESKEEIWSFEVGDLEWQEWHPCVPVLMAGTSDGNVWMWKIPGIDCKMLESPGCQATCGKILPDGKKAVVGYEDGIIRLWDLKQGTATNVIKGPDGHQGALTCVASNKDGALVLTGSVDSQAKLINTATGKVVGVFGVEDSKSGDSLGEKSLPNSVESVGFCNVLPLIAVAFLNGILDIHDLSAQTLRHRCTHEVGIVRLQWGEDSSLVIACSLDGVLRLWDARSANIVSEYRGHTAEILDFTLNRESNLAVTAGGDHQAKVFCLQKPD